MTPEDTKTGTLFLGARSAATELRHWVLRTYLLEENQLDPGMMMTLPQLDHVARHGTFYGYDVSRAPETLIAPVRSYISAIREGGQPRSGRELPRSLYKAHRRITVLMEGSLRPGSRGGRRPAS